MKATQNSTLSDEEKSEESGKVVAFATKVEQLATSSVSKGIDNSKNVTSCSSSLPLKDETDTYIEAEYDLVLDDLIKDKKCSIMLLKD